LKASISFTAVKLCVKQSVNSWSTSFSKSGANMLFTTTALVAQGEISAWS